jgi:hypothetical protein
MWRTWSIPAIALVVVSLALGGCTAINTATNPASGYCVPRVHVEPATVHAGDTITVVSDDSCGVAVPGGGWLVVAGHVGDGGKGQVTVRSSDLFDGSFRVELTLPDTFPVGEAYAGVDNWDFSPCADTASCAAPMGGFTVEQ